MIPRIMLPGGYEISRIIKGGWHLAGDHGAIDRAQAIEDMAAFTEAGITTFDCADIYTGVEELIGQFRLRYPELAARVRVHTKFVPDLSLLGQLDSAKIEATIDRSLQRLQMECLDLVQFHWWNFGIPGYVEAALELERLRQAGKIARVGLTNFDVAHMRELVDAGVSVASHQLQYSLIDGRPSLAMASYCMQNRVALFCYGTVAGGFISDRWLDQPEPLSGITNRSLIKYKLIIDDFGGWALFQQLLHALRQVADRHDVDIATVATRVILDREGVAAAIVGAIDTSHLHAHRQIGGLQLTAHDLSLIDNVTSRRQGPGGDVYSLERDRTGPHGSIMKYELNQLDTPS